MAFVIRIGKDDVVVLVSFFLSSIYEISIPPNTRRSTERKTQTHLNRTSPMHATIEYAQVLTLLLSSNTVPKPAAPPP